MLSLDFDFSPLSQTLPALADPLPRNHVRKSLSQGDAGTAETIHEMQKLVSTGKRLDITREFLGKILHGEYPGLQNCPQKDYLCYARNIYLFYRDHIKYVYDPHLVEYLERPRILLKNKIGDCDSKVISMVATWEAAGLEGQFITIKSDPDRKNEYSHVYARVFVPKYGWIVADPTMPKKDFGWEPEFFFFRKYWHGSTDSLNTPLDTQDSVKPGLFGVGMGMFDCKATTSELSGLAGLARNAISPRPPIQRRVKPARGKFKYGGVVHGLEGGGGGHHHHHGGRRRGWGWGGGWGPGWGYGGPLVIEVPVVVGTTDEISVVPEVDPYSVDPGSDENFYDVVPRGAIAMRGLGEERGTVEILTDVYNGTAAKRMDDADAELVRQTLTVNDAASKARYLPAQQQQVALSKIAQSRAAIAGEREKLLAAMGKYNNLVSEMNRWLPASSRLAPTKSKVGMVGLGYLPLAAGQIGLLAAAALAFATAFSIAMGAIGSGRSIIQDLSDTMRSFGAAVNDVGSGAQKAAEAAYSVAKIAALGLAGYLIYQNRNQISSAVGSAFKRVKARV